MGIYHIPLPAKYFSAFSFCLDYCVCGTLSVGWKSLFLFIVEPAPCGWGWSSGLLRFPGWGACVSVLVGGAGFLLSGVQCIVR